MPPGDAIASSPLSAESGPILPWAVSMGSAFGASEIQPLDFPGTAEKGVILLLGQDPSSGTYETDNSSLMAFKVVAQFLHLLNGEIPGPSGNKVRRPSQKVLVVGELHDSPCRWGRRLGWMGGRQYRRPD